MTAVCTTLTIIYDIDAGAAGEARRRGILRLGLMLGLLMICCVVYYDLYT